MDDNFTQKTQIIQLNKGAVCNHFGERENQLVPLTPLAPYALAFRTGKPIPFLE